MPRLLLALLALALAPASADASRLTDHAGTPVPEPFSSWATGLLAPLPTAVTVSDDACPGRVEPGCAMHTHEGARVFVHLAPLGRGTTARSVFLHELGHAFDYTRMNARSRDAFRRAVGYSREWRDDGPNSVHERFAEAWALCATRLDVRQTVRVAYDYLASPSVHARACNVIRAAAAGAYGSPADDRVELR